jgi:peptidyl-prolyl cis-trans isomerase C
MEIRHILVQYEYEAEDILRKLDQGSNFEDLAMHYSTCSSAKQGGYLGKIRPGKTVIEFEEACDMLKPGQMSKAIRTQFGYHIIFRIS